MKRAWSILRLFFLLAVVPVSISALVVFIVRWLIEIKFIFDDGAGVMAKVAGILIDLALQSAYFAALISVTRKYYLSILLFGYQLFMVIMFLRFGAPSLFFSIYTTLILLGLQ